MNAIDQFPPRAGSSYGGFPCSLGQRSGVRFIVPAANNLENKGGRRRRRHYGSSRVSRIKRIITPESSSPRDSAMQQVRAASRQESSSLTLLAAKFPCDVGASVDPDAPTIPATSLMKSFLTRSCRSLWNPINQIVPARLNLFNSCLKG